MTLPTASRTLAFSGCVEFAPAFRPRPEIAHVLLDFDGTLSLIRQGWPEIMSAMFMEVLPRRQGESDAELLHAVYDDIMRLNGKQTIYQMIQLAERIRERGGAPREPDWYLQNFIAQLTRRSAGRVEGLRSGAIASDDLLVHGARRMLDALIARGFMLHIASGTEETCVRAEAELLDIAKYFGGRIHGAKGDHSSFSKKMVIDDILREHAISGERLLSFGDGYVEIDDTKSVGGLAVGVASDEVNNGLGRVDPWKRKRLLDARADVIIPDYRDIERLLDCLIAKE